MKPDDDEWFLFDLEPGLGDAPKLTQIAKRLYTEGALETAATAIDLAFTITPTDPEIRAFRSKVLDSLEVREHGLTFRYVPARRYRMGSKEGDPDETPEHIVRLNAFWLSDVPVSWTLFCALVGWPSPLLGLPTEDEILRMRPSLEDVKNAAFALLKARMIRLQYCGDSTDAAVPNWHHAKRDTYELKPMVAVAWEEADHLARLLSDNYVTYRLPTEAEWEAGARGGITGARYPWGSEPPTDENCDFNRYEKFAIRPSKTYPPNGYGLYSMSGGVWEWTSDRYDARYYSESPQQNPTGSPKGNERVLRGGSWADCAGVVTTSFRTSRSATPFWHAEGGAHLSPNVGFRLCRDIVDAPAST